MKTAELTAQTTYALQEKSYGSASPVLVLEAGLWTEKNRWFDDAETGKRTERRILSRSEKGERAGTGKSWGLQYRKTGIPVLRLKASDDRFQSSVDPEHQIIDTAHDLLTRAMVKLNIMDLVDSNESVFAQNSEGATYRKTRTSVMAQFADGHTEEVSVELELVRPQSLVKDWDKHLEDSHQKALERIKLERATMERKVANDARAFEISSRVTSLLGEPECGYNYNSERRDVHRTHTSSGISTTYEIDQKTLMKLLALAEKGSQQ